jgi:plasmid maintenance system antidote protein VapI
MSSEATIPDSPVTERIEPAKGTVPEGIDGPFFQEIGKRKRQGRDAKILVTADDGATGVGKSNCCDFLGYVTDTTEAGFAPHKATIEPAEFLELYTVLEPGSALVMEEGEQFDSRRGMTNQNVAATQKWQQARVREIVALVNLPSPDMIDTRFEQLADYWINVERRGKCRIYKKKIHRTKRSVYYRTMQTLEWPNMEGSDTSRRMGALKDALLDDELNTDSLVRESEVRERINRAVEDAERSRRDEILTSLYKETDLTAGDIAECSAIEVQASRVRQIASNQG